MELPWELSGQSEDLDGAGEASRVVQDGAGDGCVEGAGRVGEFGAQGRGAIRLGQACQDSLGEVIIGGEEGLSVEEGSGIQSGSAGEHRRVPPALDVGQTVLSQAHVEGCVAGLRGLQDVAEVMGDAAAFGGGRFGGADIKAAVDQHRIAVHDLAVEGLGQDHGDGALPGACRPEDGHVCGAHGEDAGGSPAGGAPSGQAVATVGCWRRKDESTKMVTPQEMALSATLKAGHWNVRQ